MAISDSLGGPWGRVHDAEVRDDLRDMDVEEVIHGLHLENHTLVDPTLVDEEIDSVGVGGGSVACQREALPPKKTTKRRASEAPSERGRRGGDGVACRPLGLKLGWPHEWALQVGDDQTREGCD